VAIVSVTFASLLIYVLQFHPQTGKGMNKRGGLAWITAINEGSMLPRVAKV
jgi:hypothetical protein